MTTGRELAPWVWLVIPNKDGMAHLAYSLDSLRATSYDRLQTVLIDDASRDGSVAYVRERHPWIAVFENDSNLGFGGSVNRGLRYAMERGAALVAIANNDIRVRPDWLRLVIPAFSTGEPIGVVGFRELRRPADPTEILRQVLEPVRFIDVKYVSGALNVYNVAALRRAGLFDENYYMYGEETDLHARIRRAGFRTLNSNVPFWHYGEGTARKLGLRRCWLAYRNTIRYAIKNENAWGQLRLFGMLLHFGCNPFLSPENAKSSPRLRAYHPAINAAFLLAASVWNLWQLPRTLKQRRLEDRFGCGPQG